MCSNSDPYNKWLNLYNKDVETMWYSEHPQLRTAAMLLKALEHEFKRIYNNTEEKLKLCESKFNSKDKSVHDVNSIHEKENISCNKPNDESPDIFMCTPAIELNISNSSDNEMVISQENSCSPNVSPKLNRGRAISKFKKLKINNGSNYISHKLNETPKVARNLQILKDVVDTTVIQTTPEVSCLKYGKSYRTISKIAKKSKFKRDESNTTLTQMFPSICSKGMLDSTDNSDFTYCPNAEELTITTNVNIKENVEEVKPKREIIYKEPVVRGKARYKLEGWDCVDCKAFYDKLDLNTQDTKKFLNKCSRHRSKFKPQDFTPKDFWNLDFPPTQ